VAWNIQDQVDEGTASEDEYASAFMRARAASSLDFALNGDAFTAAAESIYEASAALDDPELVRELVRSAVTPGHQTGPN